MQPARLTLTRHASAHRGIPGNTTDYQPASFTVYRSGECLGELRGRQRSRNVTAPHGYSFHDIQGRTWIGVGPSGVFRQNLEAICRAIPDVN